ncbi:discoidin domain-containing protein [candidate division KSB1 bacterium]|nr:discoidin domain-containing protein [candidate division KSB1 bacterium]
MKLTGFLLLFPVALCAMEEIPQSAMTIIDVDSEEKTGENGAAVNVLDGNIDTFWHTEWYLRSPGYPHEIVFQLDRAYVIENFSYLPRRSSSNGRIKEYEIYVSNDKNSWGVPVVEGRWPDKTDQQIMDFPSPVTGQFVKLKALSEVNGNPWATAAEINLNATINPLIDIDGWASSLHLGFRDPSSEAAELLMVDIEVDETSPSTYYAAINFTGGYCGLQDQGTTRTVHFSLWDYFDGDQRIVPDDAAARILWRGHEVSGSDFGGEGTGVKTWRTYDWKTHQPYRLAVKMTAKPVGMYAGAMRDYWVFDFQSQEWLHVATLWRADNPTTGRPETDLGEVYTFVEDWAATSEWYRSCYIFNARKKYRNGAWFIYDRAHYSINDQENNPATSDGHDPNTQAEVRETNKIWLATGGTFMPENRTPSNTLLHFPPNRDFEPQVPQFRFIKSGPVNDSTMEVNWEYQDPLWAAQESYSVQIFQDAEQQNLLNSTGTLYPFDYETIAKEKDSDRKVRISGLNLEKDKDYYLSLETNTIFGFTCSKVVSFVNMVIDASQFDSTMPGTLELLSAYPNPFNTKTVISYILGIKDRVALNIYNIHGASIRTLFCGVQNPGTYQFQWDGKDDAGESLASGLYIVRVTAGAHAVSGKITLLR